MTDGERDPQPKSAERLPCTGLRVPVPKRKDVMDALRKVSEPDEAEPSRPAQESAQPE